MTLGYSLCLHGLEILNGTFFCLRGSFLPLAEVMLYIPQSHTEIGGLRKNTVLSVTVCPGHDIMVTGGAPQSMDYNILSWAAGFCIF